MKARTKGAWQTVFFLFCKKEKHQFNKSSGICFSLKILSAFGVMIFHDSLHAQNAADSSGANALLSVKSFFVSIGISSEVQYSRFLLKSAFVPSNEANPGSSTEGTYNVNNVNYALGSYDKAICAPVFSAGFGFHSGAFHKFDLNHTIELSYLSLSGNYSGSATYSEYGNAAVTSWSATVMDTFQSHFSQSVISFGYNFQPTYKCFFFSVGEGCWLNFTKIDQQKTESVSGTYDDELHPPGSYSEINRDEANDRIHFVNFPLRLQTGYHIDLKRVAITPTFSYTPLLQGRYQFYSFSVALSII
ncbi:MAG TPA: hypothetical protein VL651_02600 [Bacteroidia bacterium]|nr:hypothetical protein [Bacteroidia bacterium]